MTVGAQTDACLQHRSVGNAAGDDIDAAAGGVPGKIRCKGLVDPHGLKKGACNPFLNNVAQVVECVQVIEHGLQLLDELLTAGIKPEPVKVEPKAGEGVGCVEAPRGILFHRYAFDEKGFCTKANICIPTGQNHANIQKDFEAFAPQIIDRDQDEIRLLLEMLVRAYDPCISCSTHYLNVEFV